MEGGDTETWSSCNIQKAHAIRMSNLSSSAHEHGICQCCSCRISFAWHVLCRQRGKNALLPVQLVLNEVCDVDM